MQSRETSRKNRPLSFPLLSRAAIEALEHRTFLSAGYTITDLGEFPASVDNGSHNAVPTGVTDGGTVVGYTTRNLGGQFAAFDWTQAAGMSKLASINASTPDDPSNNTIANGLSSEGAIVGQSDSVPVFWGSVNSSPTALQLPFGATSGDAETISGSSIAGQVVSPTNGEVAVEWDANGDPLNRAPADNITDMVDVNGTLDFVGTLLAGNGLAEADYNNSAIGYLPNGDESAATGINSSLQIVGYSIITGSTPVTQAFISAAGATLQGLGALGSGQNSVATAINDSGLVVGQSYTGNNPGEAFIWSQSMGMKDLNTLLPAHSGWNLQNATAISPGGLIVGTGINPQGVAAAFLLQPKSSVVAQAGVLIPTIAKTTLPSAIVAGSAMHRSLTLNLANQTAANEKGAATLNIYAATDGSIDGNSVLLASLSHNVNVQSGKSQSLKVQIKLLPTTLSAGSYMLLGEVVDTAGAINGSNGPGITVTAPFISLSSAMSAVTARSLKSGVTITLSNGGNVADPGPITDSIGFSTDAAGQDAVGTPMTGTLISRGQIKPGKSAKKHVSGWSKLTTSLAAGQYYLTVTITDSKANTTLAVSTIPVTVG